MNPAFSTSRKFISNRKGRVRISLIAILIILAFFFCFAKQGLTLSVAVPDKIRVAVVEDAKRIELAIRGPYKVTTIETGQLLKEGDVLWDAEISPTKYGINFKTYKDEHFKIYGINIIPAESPSIQVGKSLYRGTLQLIKTKKGLLTAVNVLDTEDYVKGVLYHEISHRWPPEAIKAQAIASRTFAVYQAQQRFGKDFYLNAEASSQVYRGVFAEKFRTHRAVEETTGQILMYRRGVLPAFFHAVCGGKTQKSSNLWKVSSRPLRGVKCPFCKNAPIFSWEKSISLDEIERKISEAKYPVGKIESIKVLSRDRSGRVRKLRIKAGRTINMSAKDFRNILGPKNLNSTNFSIVIESNQAHFKGYGWGHGVGMCQWGTFAMAKKGYNCYQILEHYYPGAKVVNLE